jgi:hypothetical protein
MGLLKLFGIFLAAVLIVIAVTACLLHANFTAAFNTNEKEELIGEQYVHKPLEFAKKIDKEMHRIMNSNETTWRGELVLNPLWNNKFKLKILSKGVSGPAATFKMPIQRVSGVINASASQLFRYLTTSAGYQILDPYNDPNDFDKIIDRFDYTPGRLEVAYAHDTSNNDVVVMTLINYERNKLVSKSILHRNKPGASKACVHSADTPTTTSEQDQEIKKKFRVYMTYGMKIETYQQTKSLLTFVQLYTNEHLNNFFVHSFITATYWGPLFERIDAALPLIANFDHSEEIRLKRYNKNKEL